MVFKLTGNQTGANLILNQVIMIFGENLLLVWVALKMLGANRTPPLNKKKNKNKKMKSLLYLVFIAMSINKVSYCSDVGLKLFARPYLAPFWLWLLKEGHANDVSFYSQLLQFPPSI